MLFLDAFVFADAFAQALILFSVYLWLCPSSSPNRRELFQSRSGARENAIKILVVVTDGEKYGDSLEYEDVIPEAESRKIIRYVIGVGNATLCPGASMESFCLDPPSI